MLNLDFSPIQNCQRKRSYEGGQLCWDSRVGRADVCVRESRGLRVVSSVGGSSVFYSNGWTTWRSSDPFGFPKSRGWGWGVQSAPLKKMCLWFFLKIHPPGHKGWLRAGLCSRQGAFSSASFAALRDSVDSCFLPHNDRKILMKSSRIFIISYVHVKTVREVYSYTCTAMHEDVAYAPSL